MPDIEYVKAVQARIERQSKSFALDIKLLNPDAPVTLISKEGCAACVRLLTALEEKGVAVRKISATTDPEAKQVHDKLIESGQTIIFPITLVGENIVIGNYPDEVLKLLEPPTEE